MKAAEIVEEFCTPAAEIAEETRYALSKQVGSIGMDLDTGYGLLRLTSAEAVELEAFLRRLLELRLATLEGAP